MRFCKINPATKRSPVFCILCNKSYSSFILNRNFRIPLSILGLLTTTTFIKRPPNYHLVQHIMPNITSIIARMNSIIFVGKHKASKRPAPKAAKIIPLFPAEERDISHHPHNNIAIKQSGVSFALFGRLITIIRINKEKVIILLKLPFFNVFCFVIKRNITFVAALAYDAFIKFLNYCTAFVANMGTPRKAAL